MKIEENGESTEFKDKSVALSKNTVYEHNEELKKIYL